MVKTVIIMMMVKPTSIVCQTIKLILEDTTSITTYIDCYASLEETE